MAGIYVASITPFDNNDKVNTEALEALLNLNITQGADGFFIGGSSAESFLMSTEERIITFNVASFFIGKTNLFAHVGAIRTEEAIYFAKEAKNLGYGKISATPPFYYGFDQKAIAQYFYDISNAVDMPVLYYNIPMNTNKEIDLSDKDTIALLKSGVISGIKHTSFNIYQMHLIRSINSDLICYGGLEQNMVSFLAMGCDGFIGSTFNFMLPHYKKIYELFNEKKIDEARELQVKANNIMDTIWSIGLFSSIKYILTKNGIDAGLPRRPFIQLTEEEKKRIDATLLKNLCN